MVLYLIGLGLGNEKDITLKGLEAVRKCEKVYLEKYTSRIVEHKKEELEKVYEKKIQEVDRSFVEGKVNEIVEEAKKKDVALLIGGSPFAATTHIEFLICGKKRKVQVKVIENASVITAIGITGLFIYKFGRITTIPRENKNVTSPFEVIQKNQQMGLHTLLLLDVDEKSFMTAEEGVQYLIRQGLDPSSRVVGCAALGSDDPEIKVAEAKRIKLNKVPQCLIIPARELHFKEQEGLEMYKE